MPPSVLPGASQAWGRTLWCPPCTLSARAWHRGHTQSLSVDKYLTAAGAELWERSVGAGVTGEAFLSEVALGLSLVGLGVWWGGTAGAKTQGQTGPDSPPWGQPFCSLFLQARGSSPVSLDLIIPFLRPGCCVLVWRSDVQFAWKHLLCPDVSYRHLGLLILALLALLTLLGVVLALTCRRPQSGPGPARPVLLLHAADSEAQRRLVGALAELLRAALGGGRDVIVDLWEGRHVARVGPLPWLWAARTRVAREQGTVLLLWSGADLRPVSGPDPRAAPLLALLHAAPRPLLLLAYFSRLCAKGDIPPPLRALPRYRLLRDLPRLLRALDARPFAEATSWGRLGARQRRQSRLELCSRLEREAARLADLG
ncbi:interleukin-17 receptor E isoform X11 [Homo sapiens]|uniref:interleukin-17 receptor E isoform X11 n=1 Tax=Homo sapiens TaxID=9606 RepID=UPI001FB121F5|nr:interleukin-17 receptor E isoform X11 [Homo sapiens]XP_054201251.1 interleukin-17 receptor E isoform X11 [Homo sapiens]